MRSPAFRRFVAIFVGVILILAIVFGISTGDDGMLGLAAGVAGLYAIYLFVFIKKEKEQKKDHPKSQKSPLLRR